MDPLLRRNNILPNSRRGKDAGGNEYDVFGEADAECLKQMNDLVEEVGNGQR